MAATLPEHLDIRPATADDQFAVYALFEDHSRNLVGIVQRDARRIRRIWPADVEKDVRVIAAPDGTLIGFILAHPDTRTWVSACVHPAYQGQGIGTALIKQAVNGATGSGAMQARAVVAVKNQASRRAFEVADFRVLPKTHHLMRCDVAGATARPSAPGMEAVRPLTRDADAQRVLQLAPSLTRTVEDVTHLADVGTNTYLIAECDGRVTAFVEMVKVQQLHYAGAWVETLVAPVLSAARISRPGSPSVVEGAYLGGAVPLIASAVEWAKAEGLDEIGCLVAVQDWQLHHAFASEGFTSAGEYLVLMQTF